MNTGDVGGGKSGLLALHPLLAAVSEPTRWQILRLLSDGQPKTVLEVARAIGRSSAAASKHLLVLKDAGVVVSGQARMYRIAAQHFAEPGRPHLDFGYVLLRLDVSQPA